MSSTPFSTNASALMLAMACALAPVLSGCTQGKFPVAEAKGKVVCNGQPVTSGSVTFSPVGDAEAREVGKPATATVGADGTFILSTDDRFDGAVIGKHTVQYVASEGDEEEEGPVVAEGSPEEAARNAERTRKLQARQSQCVQQGEIVVEVQSDSTKNDFTIELVPAGN